MPKSAVRSENLRVADRVADRARFRNAGVTPHRASRLLRIFRASRSRLDLWELPPASGHVSANASVDQADYWSVFFSCQSSCQRAGSDVRVEPVAIGSSPC